MCLLLFFPLPAVPALLLPANAFAGARVTWTADVLAGHDDQVLSDPERLGVVAPVSEDFFSTSTRLLLRLDDARRANRLDLVGEATGTSYGSKVDGGDRDLRFTGAYRRLSGRFALDVSGAYWHFRRSGAPVFDLNLGRFNALLAWSLHPRFWLGLEAGYDLVDFPGRYFADSTGTENQHQADAGVSAAFHVGEEASLALRVVFRNTTSNLDRLQFDGPLVEMRTRFVLPADIEGSGMMSLGSRRYPDFLFFPDPSLLATDRRWDETWQAGLTLEHQLWPRVKIFLDGNLLRQSSNVPEFDYNQGKVALGFSVSLVAPPSFRGPSLQGPPPLAPTRTSRGVVFRIRAPQAQAVYLVGGFNGWSTEANPMSGPDEDGVWTVSVEMEPGIWRYGFVVDGSWIRPPDAPRYEADGFGGEHGIVEVTKK